MLCNMCNQREAVLFVQQVSFGGKKEIHLCSDCAQTRGIDMQKQKDSSTVEKFINAISFSKKGCYVCGKTFDDIKKSESVGCPECYISFHKEIKQLLENKGAEVPYMGEMPKKLSYFRSILTDRIEIQKKLDNSIEKEDYEKAAMYRDFLKSIERTAISDSAREGDMFDE